MRVPRAPAPKSLPPANSRGTGGTGGAEGEESTEAVRLLVASLMLSGAPSTRVAEIVNTRDCVGSCGRRVPVDVTQCPHCAAELAFVRHRLSLRTVQLRMQEIRADLHAEYKDRRATIAAEQVERLQNDLLRMRSSAKVPWSSVNQHERLLADITGTIAPRRVHLTGDEGLAASLVSVLAGMTAEERERAIIEQRELMRAAGRDVIDVPGVVASSTP